MSIYGIPPLLSSIILFMLFLMGLTRAKRSPESLLFALICLVGCFLNTDKAILTVCENEQFALRISRIDHAFLVFVIPLYFHFSLLVTGYRRWLPLTKILYVSAILLVPLTQSHLYLTGVKRHFFGYFALTGPLFFLFAGLNVLSVSLSLYLLVKGFRNEKVSVKRTRIKYILLSFGLAAFATQFNIITMMGHEIYPLGSFAFIPMSLLGYAIYKHDVMEWKVFLNKGIVFSSLLLISVGFFVGIEVLLKGLRGVLTEDGVYILSMVLTFLLIYFSFNRIQHFLEGFLIQEFVNNRKTIKYLSLEILKLHSVIAIREKVIEGLSRTFVLEKCNIKMVAGIDEEETPTFLTESDPFWGQGYRLSIPIPSHALPSYLFLGEKGNMSLYTGEELEILSMLSHNIALALDNAKAYKEIEDFSSSLERLVDERTRALIQSESLAAVGRLAAGVAHELNNPLASVMSTLEYSIDHMEDKGELYDDLAFSLQELKRVKEIVRSLLDASRQKQEEKRLLDVHGPIEDALKILNNQYRNKGIEIIKELDADQPFLIGNPQRLCQVFINLFKNSIDAIGEQGGVIRITTQCNGVGNLIDDGPTKGASRRLMCIISDNGHGMEKGLQKDIFKPFFTTKEQGKGIGLGLYIVFEIIKDHGGSIEVESETGKGTVFTLSFPCRSQ